MVAAGPPLSSFLLPTPLDQELLQGGDSLRQPQPPSTWGQDSQRRHLDTGSRSHHPQGHVGGLGSRDGEEPEPGKWSHVLASQRPLTHLSLLLHALNHSVPYIIKGMVEGRTIPGILNSGQGIQRLWEGLAPGPLLGLSWASLWT